MPNLEIPNIHGGGTTCTFDKVPDRCPMCHNGIQPIDTGCVHLKQPERHMFEWVFRCPVATCQSLFIARYQLVTMSGMYFLKACLPCELRNCSLPKEVQQISGDFCLIYNEAHKAEQYGLKLVSGPGYRKSLEFLVKDYLTSLQTTAEAKKDIAELSLAAVIKKYVADSRIKTTAERAAWLGNDETHYIRKWEDKDLQDMKNLIDLTCYWIMSEHLTKAAAVEMPDGKK